MKKNLISSSLQPIIGKRNALPPKGTPVITKEKIEELRKLVRENKKVTEEYNRSILSAAS